MAENKVLEREYTIPLRRELLKVQQYERSGRAIKAIKKFIAKHMKVEDRDISKVKLDVYFNNEVWYRGRTNPPTKVKVKARKENGIVSVTFVDTPDHVKFLKAKNERFHAKAEKPAPVASKPEEKVEKTEEQKKDEKEKETATAEANVKIAETAAKVQKHVEKVKNVQHPQRMALKK